MPINERHTAMLAEMGVRLWSPRALQTPTVKAEPVAAQKTASEFIAPLTQRCDARHEALVSAQNGVPIEAQPPVASLPWSALRLAVSQCQACPLGLLRKQAVFGVGHERAHWMIVGEAPGEQEDEQGEPFVGKSGQLLNNMLRSIGLTREPAEPHQQVYIANTVKCRPAHNRNPEPAELAQCQPYLAQQIALIEPRIIVAMGRFAVQSLLKSAEPLGRLRGQVHRYHGTALVVTYHPAYLLRNPQDKARAWQDLCLAKSIVQALP
jgi:uracil-DNA glycosylase